MDHQGMQLTKRTRTDNTNGSLDNADQDGGDILPTTVAYTASGGGGSSISSGNRSSTSSITSCSTNSAASIIAPRKSIRDYDKNRAAFEDSYLLYKGRKSSYLMVPLSKALTWLTKICIYYHHTQYLSKRLLAYFGLILFAGFTRDHLLSPSSPLPVSLLTWIEANLRTSKRNPLNLYFVKLGWLWTFIALIPFFIFTRYHHVRRQQEKYEKPSTTGSAGAGKVAKRKKSVHFREPLEDSPHGTAGSVATDTNTSSPTVAIDDPSEMVAEMREYETEETEEESLLCQVKQFCILYARQLLPTAVRLSIATLIWYYSVNFFVYYADLKGECRYANSTLVEAVANDKEACSQAEGGHWHMGFDISGHIFLMVFSNLIRIEELNFLLRKFEEFAQFRYLNLSRSRSMNYAMPYRFTFSFFHLTSLFLLLLSLLVTLVWDFMILQTAFFYHTWDQKFAGYVWAVLAWAATYHAAFTLPQLRLQVAPL